MIIRLLVILTLALQSFNYSQNNVATTSAAFLEIGPGARSIGMGSAYVSVADDASSIYWNPAGIASLNQTEVQSLHSLVSRNKFLL